MGIVPREYWTEVETREIWYGHIGWEWVGSKDIPWVDVSHNLIDELFDVVKFIPQIIDSLRRRILKSFSSKPTKEQGNTTEE